jgi:N6-L-threonylcarbamoyladenine synthase
MLDRPGLEFSFSGLKTAVMLAVRERDRTPAFKADVARGVEEAIVETLCVKTLRALEFTGHDVLVVAGGVGANQSLRAQLTAAARARGTRVYYPRPEFCTDNAAMIALAGLERLRAGECSPRTIRVRARWNIAELAPPGKAAAS